MSVHLLTKCPTDIQWQLEGKDSWLHVCAQRGPGLAQSSLGDSDVAALRLLL